MNDYDDFTVYDRLFDDNYPIELDFECECGDEDCNANGFCLNCEY
jgi:hypothetical protein